MKSVILSLLLSFALISPSFALEDLSRIRCESADAKAAILKMMSTMRFDDGRSFASEGFSANSIVSISTQSAARNKLVCKLTIKLGVRGATQNIRGRFTIRQFSNGKLTAEWSPFS